MTTEKMICDSICWDEGYPLGKQKGSILNKSMSGQHWKRKGVIAK